MQGDAARALRVRDAVLMESALMLTDRKTVSIPRACEIVGVSRRTIYNWIAGGKVQYVRTAGGSVRIFEDTLWREPSTLAEEPVDATDWHHRLSRGA
jgi:excisionase family DNA binding protein